jgi:hypothetical protein
MPVSQLGNELAEVPFGELLRSVAQGIADGQKALDLTSIQTMITLANTPVSLIPEVTEVITAAPYPVPVSGGSVQVTGVRVAASAATPIIMTALQAGILPTFYQFSEATIQLKVALQVRQVEETDAAGNQSVSLGIFSSNVNFKTQNTYSFSGDASSSVTAIIRPTPPPTRVTPSVITVNTLGRTPTVTVNP